MATKDLGSQPLPALSCSQSPSFWFVSPVLSLVIGVFVCLNLCFFQYICKVLTMWIWQTLVLVHAVWITALWIILYVPVCCLFGLYSHYSGNCLCITLYILVCLAYMTTILDCFSDLIIYLLLHPSLAEFHDTISLQELAFDHVLFLQVINMIMCTYKSFLFVIIRKQRMFKNRDWLKRLRMVVDLYTILWLMIQGLLWSVLFPKDKHKYVNYFVCIVWKTKSNSNP